jgi:hypothetical protein
MATDKFIASMVEGGLRLTQKDQGEITVRLTDILNSLRAIHRLAIEGLDQEHCECYMIAIAEMARANVRGVDAVNVRLGALQAGNFANEFSHS